jgi:uncharacterized membrane protein YbhN (UPF0104 family)
LRHHARRFSVFGLGFLFTVVFGYLALRDVRWADFWHALESSNFWWLVPALVLLAAGVFLRAVRWRYLFDPRTRPPIRDVTDAMLIGYLYNNLLPGRAGEIFRIFALHRFAGTRKTETAATVIVERVYDILCLLLLLVAVLPWLPNVTWLNAAGILASVLVVGLIVTIALLARFGDRALRWALRPLAALPFISPQATDAAADSLTRGLASLRGLRLGVIAIVTTTVSWILISISFWFVMVALHLHLSPVAGVLVAICTGISLVIPSSPAALGVFEAAGIAALRPYGIPQSTALSYSVVLHALNLFPFLLAGAVVIRLRARDLSGRRSKRLEPPLVGLP